MGSSARNYFITLLLYLSVVNEINLPVVKCQEEEADQCLPRKTFFALLRLPEVSSNLAAYSRTARIIQDAKNRNEIANLKSLSTEDTDDAEICLPVAVYLDLFSDPAMRGHLSAIGRAQKMFEDPTTRTFITSDNSEPNEDDEELDSEKRSLATLAKNGDLPISIQDKTDEEDEEEKRSLATLVHDAGPLTREELEALLQYSEINKRNIAALARDYGLPNGKRNVASLARDFALPPTTSGKRNVAALARDFALPSGKRNVAALARDFALPSGKRNVAALARDYALPSGKRNIAALARDYGLPYGKRYIDIFSRGSATRYLQPYGDKRNLAALVRNGDLPVNYKRNIAALAREWTLPTQNRYGRSLEKLENRLREGPKDLERLEERKGSLTDDADVNEKKLEALANSEVGKTAGGFLNVDKMMKERGKAGLDNAKKSIKSGKKVIGDKRPKRQIDFSDEYPLPVMQNTNVLDYEDMLEALAGDYPNTEKRFMASEPMDAVEENDQEDFYVAQPAKRHIGALARLGWLPSFRAARFSRSPRYLVNRENSADGTSANNPTDSTARTLGIDRLINRYSKSKNFGDCRHGFKRFLLIPAVDKLLLHKLYKTPKTT